MGRYSREMVFLYCRCSGYTLADSKDFLTARKYWNKLKERLKKEENETVSNCHQLKLEAADGKMRLTDVANTKAKDYLKIEES